MFSSLSTAEPSKIPLNFLNETELSFDKCDHVLLSPLVEFKSLVSFLLMWVLNRGKYNATQRHVGLL